jgi:hypothetical protein
VKQFENKLSKYQQLRRGLSQGAVRVLTQFSMVINDLLTQSDEVQNTKPAFFADGLVLGTSLPKHEEQRVTHMKMEH